MGLKLALTPVQNLLIWLLVRAHSLTTLLLSGIIGHAYYPQYGGDAHFDDQELWTLNQFAVRIHFSVVRERREAAFFIF